MNIEASIHEGILSRLSSIRSTTAQKLLWITIKASITPPPRMARAGQFNAIRFVNCSACLAFLAIIQGATLNLSTREAYQREPSCLATLVAWPRYSLINLICLDDIHIVTGHAHAFPAFCPRQLMPVSPLHPSIFPLLLLSSSNVEIRIRQFMRIVRHCGMRISSSCGLVSSCCLMTFELQFEFQCNDRGEIVRRISPRFLDFRF